MDKKTTQAIKGIAILIMIMHHFCAATLFPDLSAGFVKFGAACKGCLPFMLCCQDMDIFLQEKKQLDMV